MVKHIFLLFALLVLSLCACNGNKTEQKLSSPLEEELPGTQKEQDKPESTGRMVTAEQAYEGVNNYCHREYDWSAAEENPSLMSVTMGEATDSEYQVIFRSYTGALVYFQVEKASGTTRVVEYEPTLDLRNEVGTIDLFDYLPETVE